jgi:hypothetical protein
MKHEESFRLMELMLKMGYPSNVIMVTLDHCAHGEAIGPAFMKAYTCYLENKMKEYE